MTDLYRKYAACDYRVTTDSRAITGGELFFALKGENFDGNAYALQALEKGASYAVVSDPDTAQKDERMILVEDTYTALRDLAIEHRNTVRDGKLPVIGLTGTNGKTTTKELIAAVLSQKYNVTATRGNLNNDIGVPLSLLSIRPDTEIAVIEMGANHPDDIEKLVKISQPGYGLITNVGRAHLLGFGSFEGVKRAKGALYRWLGAHEGSLIFLNEDDADLREMAAREACHNFGYGIHYQNVELITTGEHLALKIGGRTIQSHLFGAYNVTNILAALCVGKYFGVSEENAAAAIEGYVPANNRSQIVSTAQRTIVVDAYNANPSSMRAALEGFAAMRKGAPDALQKTALLGDMRELGAESENEHCKIVRLTSELGIETIFVGSEFRKALDRTGFTAAWFETSEALAEWLQTGKKKGTYLVKGSRGIQMEKTIPVLQEED